MAYFVTGATGFIGRFLLAQLLEREGTIYALCRASSLDKLDELKTRLGADEDRIVPVIGDLSKERLGVDQEEIDRLDGHIDHFFHLAAIYDLTADADSQHTANVEGTRHALALAGRCTRATSTMVSSIAAAGLYKGTFTEDMFDEAQDVEHNPYYQTKHESEGVVRRESPVPWRIYRPGVVVGHSETGEIDKIDGPYYFFKTIQRLRGVTPSWLRGVGIEGGEINLVPVDYVAKAMDYIAHLPDLDGQTFHLTDPEPLTVGGLFKALTKAAKAPQPSLNVDARALDALPARLTTTLDQPAGRQAGHRPRAGRARHPARDVRLPHLPDALRLDQDAGRPRRLGHRAARVLDVRADALGVLGARVQPRPPQGQAARPGHQGQDGDDHGCVVGHRARDGAAGRCRRRHGDPRRARRGEARADEARDRGPRRRPRSSTAATCPTSATSSGWPRRCCRSTAASTCWSTTPAARSAARSRCPTTASTTSSAPCS